MAGMPQMQMQQPGMPQMQMQQPYGASMQPQMNAPTVSCNQNHPMIYKSKEATMIEEI